MAHTPKELPPPVKPSRVPVALMVPSLLMKVHPLALFAGLAFHAPQPKNPYALPAPIRREKRLNAPHASKGHIPLKVLVCALIAKPASIALKVLNINVTMENSQGAKALSQQTIVNHVRKDSNALEEIDIPA